MDLRKQMLAKSMNTHVDFPIKFTRISAKDSSAKKTTHLVGLSKVAPTSMDLLTLPKSRTISKVVVYKAIGGEPREGHWSMMFTADRSPDKKESPSPAEKLIRVDLVQDSYRIVYNANPEEDSGLHTTEYKFQGTQPTAEDIYRVIVDVGKQKGRWTEGYNCQDFVNEVIQRLGTLPSPIVLSS